MTEFVLFMNGFELNMTWYVIKKTGLVMTRFGVNMAGLVKET